MLKRIIFTKKIVNKDFKFNFKNLTLKDITYIHQSDNNEKVMG